MERNAKVAVVRVCRQLGMTRQNYYKGRMQRKKEQVDAGLLAELVGCIRCEHPRMGVRKLYHLVRSDLEEAGVKMGRDKVFEILKEWNLLVAPKKRLWPKTTQYRPYLPVFTNLIRALVVGEPNEVWVADITYIRTRDGYLYLSLLTDKWSRKVVGWDLSESLEGSGCLKALRRAAKAIKKGTKVIHHSDRGCQYASHRYVQALEELGMRASMTEKDHCAENAMAERVNGILKDEYYLDQEFRTKEEAVQAVRRGIYSYNMSRPHSCLKMKTPEEVHSLAA